VILSDPVWLLTTPIASTFEGNSNTFLCKGDFKDFDERRRSQ
jgi:hypothetical protein